MKLKVGDVVKTKLYGDKFIIKVIHESELIDPYAVLTNEPYRKGQGSLRLMVDMEKLEQEWWKVNK